VVHKVLLFLTAKPILPMDLFTYFGTKRIQANGHQDLTKCDGEHPAGSRTSRWAAHEAVFAAGIYGRLREPLAAMWLLALRSGLMTEIPLIDSQRLYSALLFILNLHKSPGAFGFGTRSRCWTTDLLN
jgi:hypothetical protein